MYFFSCAVVEVSINDEEDEEEDDDDENIGDDAREMLFISCGVVEARVYQFAHGGRAARAVRSKASEMLQSTSVGVGGTTLGFRKRRSSSHGSKRGTRTEAFMIEDNLKQSSYDVVTAIGPRQFFAEHNFLFGQTGGLSFVAVDYCELYSLTWQGLEDVLKEWPQLRSEFGHMLVTGSITGQEPGDVEQALGVESAHGECFPDVGRMKSINEHHPVLPQQANQQTQQANEHHPVLPQQANQQMQQVNQQTQQANEQTSFQAASLIMSESVAQRQYNGRGSTTAAQRQYMAAKRQYTIRGSTRAAQQLYTAVQRQAAAQRQDNIRGIPRAAQLQYTAAQRQYNIRGSTSAAQRQYTAAQRQYNIRGSTRTAQQQYTAAQRPMRLL
eukprot:gene21560-28553_t